MHQTFFSIRERICGLPHIAAKPVENDLAVVGKCWHNVSHMVAQFGGSLAYGWALAHMGPIPVSDCWLPPLYSRWINHVVWCDDKDRLWDIIPHPELIDSRSISRPVIFVADDLARFDTVSDACCFALPAVYIATRPEGEWTADCLNSAERSPIDLQEQWLDRALYSTRLAGFVPIKWQIERLHDRISDLRILASVPPAPSTAGQPQHSPATTP